MKSTLLFGFRDSDLEAARLAAEAALGIRMTLQESSYRCGDYFRFGRDWTEHFILQKNFDTVEREWSEPAFEDFGILLYVGETDREQEIRDALIQSFLLLSPQTPGARSEPRAKPSDE